MFKKKKKIVREVYKVLYALKYFSVLRVRGQIVYIYILQKSLTKKVVGQTLQFVFDIILID